MTGNVRRAMAVAGLAAIATTASADTLEAILQPKTAQGFARYVAAVEARIGKELSENGPFLDIDRQPAAQQARTLAALRQGEVVVTRGVARDDSASEIAIEGGLINHWRYQQAGDGVIVEIESLTLSRNLPPIIGALIRPIVNSTARESMTRTLASVRARFMQ